MDWFYLILAGFFEITWPTGFKIAQMSEYRINWIVFACVGMAISGFFLYLAQRSIPVGIAYATWAGIGALGTFLIGVLFFGDSSSLLNWLGLALIIGGIVLLKISHFF